MNRCTEQCLEHDEDIINNSYYYSYIKHLVYIAKWKKIKMQQELTSLILYLLYCSIPHYFPAKKKKKKTKQWHAFFLFFKAKVMEYKSVTKS